LLFFCLLSGRVTLGSTPPLQKEAFSREAVLFVGADAGPPRAQTMAREVTLYVGADAGPARAEGVSREVCLMVSTPQVPAQVTPLAVSLAAVGDAVALDWRAYDELSQRDIVRYDIYVSDGSFTNVAGMTPRVSVAAGTPRVTLAGFSPYRDVFVAVVAVDVLGGFDSIVFYSAAYFAGREAVTREATLFVGADRGAAGAEAVSREACLMVSTPAPPERVLDPAVGVTPRGDAVTLDWSTYDELRQRDVVRYEVFLQDRPFTNVVGMTPHAVLPSGASRAVFDGLPLWQDRYLAVVAVDVLGGFDPVVDYAGAYVLSPETFFREATLFVGGDAAPGGREAASREVVVMVADAAAPAPVTYRGSPFAAVSSVAAYRAVDLDWSQYDEWASRDVVRYRVYLAAGYFSDVSSMQPVAYASAGTRRFTLDGLQEYGTYAVAVVAEDAMGRWNPVVHSAFASASAARLYQLELRAWLQGPYDAGAGRMGAALQPDLPLASPYADDVIRVSSVATNVTDWILGEMRDAGGQRVESHSLWLRADGRVVSPGHTQTLWKVGDNAALRLVLRHRNHLAAVSATPIAFTNDTVSYTFATGPAAYAGGTNACVELEPGVWGMIAGDADGDGRITPVDREIVRQQRGKTGYLSGDLNLDGVVTTDEGP
jgi:hypothetical protein